MIKSVEISNFGGIDTIKFDCKKFNVFAGANEQGKSTILEAIRWAIVGGDDDGIIKNGQSKCEVILYSDTGAKIERRLSRGGTNKLYVYQNDNPMADPQKVLNKIYNPKLFDPTSLVTMNAKELNKFISDAISKRLTLTEAQKEHYQIKDLDLGDDPVEAITKRHKKLYDSRTEVNRTVKTLSIQMQNVVKNVDPAEIEKLEKEIKELRDNINKSNAHNTKLEISKNNIAIRDSTQATVNKLKEEIDTIKDVDIDALLKEAAEKSAKLTELKKEYEEGKTSYKVLREVLTKISGGITCPVSNLIQCKTDMTPFKKDIEDKVVKLNTDSKKIFPQIEALQKELDALSTKTTTYTNINNKKLELSRLESMLEQLQIFTGDAIDVKELEEQLTNKSNQLNTLKSSLEVNKTSGLQDEEKRQAELNEKLKLLKELLEVVIPDMLKIGIKDLVLSKDGIYYKGVQFVRLSSSLKLRLSIGILKDLFPKANIYNIDQLEKIDYKNLSKYIDVYTKQQNQIQYFAAYVGEIKFDLPTNAKVFTMENFAIKG